MTREEAIEELKVVKIGVLSDTARVALNMAIKALEQEPYEDYISRQAVLDEIETVCFSKEWIKFRVDYGSNGTRDYIINYIKQLPSIQPEQKAGQWYIDERPESDKEVICSNCEQPIFKYRKIDFDYRPKYCPNCGVKMEEGE